jgi:mRNA interferase RelE/StbE
MTASYQVELTKSAKKEFDRLPTKIQDKIIEALQFLSFNPFSEFLKIKKLKGAEVLFRIRMGDYRIVYEVKKDVLVVLVIKIGHCKEVYRGF